MTDVIGTVVYARVSTKEQVQNLSLSTQRHRCEAYCREQGFKVLGVFVDEGESAKTANRPELRRPLDYCRENQGRVQHLVVYRLDRFARQAEDHVALSALLRRFGVTVRSATEAITDD